MAQCEACLVQQCVLMSVRQFALLSEDTASRLKHASCFSTRARMPAPKDASSSDDCCPCVDRGMADVRSLPGLCCNDGHRCKWCLRAFDAPNPILPQRALKPKLQRRAPRSLELATCPRVIARSCLGIKLDALECELRSTTKKFEEFREVVAHLERLVNEGTPLPRRRGRG